MNRPENQQQLTPALSQTSLQTRLSDRLAPATAKAGTAELLACLTLVAPSGMSEGDRNAWVQVARQTLKGIPADLLQRGCEEARKRCKFASEIVPTIVETTEREWNRRRRAASDERVRNAPRLPQPDLVDASDIRKLIKSIGR